MCKDIIFIFVLFTLMTQVYTDVLNNVNIEHDPGGSINLEDGQSSTIYFVYTISENPDITATLNNRTQVTITVDRASKSGFITLNSNVFHQNIMGYGTYILTINVSGYNNTCKITVNFEEAIQGLQILINHIVPVNENVCLKVTVEKGSNFIITVQLKKLDGDEIMNRNTNDSRPSRLININVVEPGSFVLCVTVLNSVSSKKVQESIEAIYKINDLTVSGPGSILHITENTQYTAKLHQSVKLPMGFLKFEMDFGDGDFFTRFEDPLYLLENEVSYFHQYQLPGNYSAKLVISNVLGSHTYMFKIDVVDTAIAIPAENKLLLQVNGYEFPVTANVSFTFSMLQNDPTPTDVVCTFDYGDSNREHASTSIKYGDPVQKFHAYNSIGDFDVVFSCSNDINSVQKTIRVYSRSFRIEDFIIHYPSVIASTMTSPTIVPESVEFIVKLDRFSILPSSVMITWYFEDGSPNEEETISSLKKHTFSRRGTIHAHAKIDQYGVCIYRDLTIQIGVFTFYLDRTVGHIHTDTFKYVASGLQNGYYLLSYKPDKTVNLTGTDVEYNTIYDKPGSYYPHVTGINGTYRITEYLPEIFFNVNIESITIKISNYTVDQPPGEVQIRFNILKDEGFCNCFIDMGDFIDKDIYQFSWNMTYENTIVFNYTYLTLGVHNVWINCSNPLSKIETNVVIESLNECFKVTGIFDRQYSNKNNPMKVYTSAEVSLSNRMPVLCTNNYPVFYWTFSKHVQDAEWTNVNKSLPHTPTGSIRFNRGEMDEGLYKITLKVSLSGTKNTYVIESTYMRFEKPPPFAYIVGGSQRIGKIGTQSIDGLTLSYDAGQSVGAYANLRFSWSCKRFQSSSLTELESAYDTYLKFPSNDPSFLCTGIIHNTTQGIAVLNVISDMYSGYALTVTACIESFVGPKCSSYTQLLQTLSGNPPSARIQCDINCKEKYAVTTSMKVMAVCDDCTGTELKTLSYKWQMWQKIDYSRVTIQDFDETGTLESSLVIKPDVLHEGSVYYLSIEMTLPTRNTTGQSVIELITNYRAYGGTCHVQPESGNATTTPFAIICSGWRDEGNRDSRNSTKDIESNEPLLYEYISFVKKKLSTGSTYEIGIPLFRGGESSATEILLSVGDEYFQHMITIMIRVYDYYGDYIEYNITAQVFSDENMIPKDSEDTGALDYMMDVFGVNFDQIQAGGNAVATVQVIGSTASLLGKNSDSSNATAVSNNSNEPETLVEEKKQNIVESFTSQILNVISVGDGGRFSASDAAQVVRSIETCMNEASQISENTMDNVIEASSKLSDNVLSATNKSEPFPIETIKSIDECADGISSTIQKTLSSMLPDDLVDIDDEQEIDEDMVKDEVDKALLDNDSTKLTDSQLNELRGRITQEKVDKLKKKLEKQRKKQKSAKKNVPKMMSAIDKVLKTKLKLMVLGQPEEVILKDGVILSTEKVRKNKLLANGKKQEGFKIDFDSLPDDDGFEVGMTYFEKPPQIYGKGSSKISSPSVSLTMKNIQGNAISMPLSVTVKNSGMVHYNKYRPVVDPNDPEQMIYVQYKIKDTEDATLIFVKPDSLDFESYETFQKAFSKKDFTLYYVYASNASNPSSSNNLFETMLTVRDWTHPFGFKILIGQGLLTAGVAYLGLKPIIENTDKRRRKRSLESANLQRLRREADNDTISGQDNATISVSFNPLEVNFSMAIATTGCRMWNDAEEAWVSNGCKVSSLSTLNETVCKCPKQSSNGISIFATTFYVPPNTIDFYSVFSKFDLSNASVYGTVAAIIVLYSLLVVWVRKQDGKDLERWATYFLCDNDESDTYYYILTVHTGLRRGAGTKSNVNFNLIGLDMESGIRYLGEGFGKGFETGSVRKFIMTTKYPLGILTYLRIWHDNSGCGSDKSWYLYKILVDDVQRQERYCFHCDQWLALEEGDGQTERALPSITKEDLNVFSRLVSQEARANLTENHLWLSVLMRPERSRFSRTQRLSCILAFLFLTMIANAMFFRSSTDTNPSEIQVGFLRFSLQTLYVSAISIAITTVPIALVAIFFKYSNPKKSGQNKSNSRNIDEINSWEISSDIYIKSGIMLPHWSLYCGWILIILAVVSSGFFLILYSMEWGKDKSEEWLSSFALSFVESVIIADPLKVMLIAMVVAVIFRTSDDERPLKVDIEKLRLSARNATTKSQKYIALRTDILYKSTPPPTTKFKSFQEKLNAEVQARRVLIQLIVYIIYTFVIYSIGYVNRDYRSFYMKENIQNYLVTSSKTKFGFSKVHTDTTLYEWMNSTFFPNYFPVVDYNENVVGTIDKLFFGDFANLRIGPARLRQIRMKEESCRYHNTFLTRRTCVMYYTIEDEDTDRYCLNWEQYNHSSCILTSNPGMYFTKNAWRYISPETIWGIQISGQYNTYGGGGYILNFEIDLINSQNLINELKEYKWIDRRTRAVFMEYTLYNANANIFAYVIFLCEFVETGKVITMTDVQTFRPYQDIGSVGTYVYICYFVYLIVLFISSIKTVIHIKSLKFKYFQPFWNKVDILCYIMSYLAIVMWVFRLIYTQQAMAKYYDNKEEFINFQHVVIWDYSFNIVIGILVSVATIRILRILGYNERLIQIANVLSRAWASLLGFGILLIIILLSYAILGYLLFGSSTYTYRSMFVCVGSLANTMIGKNSVKTMEEVSQSFAMFYFITYFVAVIFIFITIFMAILNESISAVRAELANKKSTYGVVDVLTNTIKNLLGLLLQRKSKRQKKDTRIPGKYKPKERKNVRINTVNVISLVRETFDSLHGFKDTGIKDADSLPNRSTLIPNSELRISGKSKKYQSITSNNSYF